MAQHKFGTRRPAMLSFERQPFPAPCHVDQDVSSGHRDPRSLLHHSHVITIRGDSYRLKENGAAVFLQKPTAAEARSEKRT